MLAGLIVPEVRLPGPGGDGEAVVGDAGAPANRFERHLACVQVNVEDFTQRTRVFA